MTRVLLTCGLTVAALSAQQDVMFQPAQEVKLFYNRSDAQGVKGAPYSAVTVTESTQTLADGNRIVHKNKSSFARDSQGRTRREMTVGSLGPLGQADQPLTSVVIDDAVTRTVYSLDPKSKTYTKSRVATIGQRGTPGVKAEIMLDGPPRGVAAAGQLETVVIEEVREMKRGVQIEDAKAESLGEKNFDGVMARGTRTTLTIPAGQVGNEKPIEVVTETWHSEQLKATVYSRHFDPRFGETTTRLENVNVGEPSAHLFTVPADYKEQKAEIFERKIMVRDEL